ncbi:hypothetical protein [Acetivibrio straminisolvens]|jgi:hypothetical protein|nr:hypothetical protein [Acetivibrio straminisolvens]
MDIPGGKEEASKEYRKISSELFKKKTEKDNANGYIGCSNTHVHNS